MNRRQFKKHLLKEVDRLVFEVYYPENEEMLAIMKKASLKSKIEVISQSMYYYQRVRYYNLW